MNIKLYEQYLSAENYLESLSNMTDVNFFNGTSNPDHHFQRAKHFLKLAGNPDKDYKIIHVAGTSGKGSTCNYIYNILQKAGYKVGAHFSPFVSVATEKIQINNKLISPQEFIDLVEEIKPIIEKCTKTFDVPSYFECWFLLALLYFKKQKCDYVVLETGCGGKYDGSNAVLKTAASVITSIGFDHMHILGNTIPEIAAQKAGIIREKSQVFTAVERPEALKVIEKVCEEKNADLTIIEKSENPNQALATAVAEYFKIPVPAIKAGLLNTKLPARLEIMQDNPLVILDGAHNPDKIAFLTRQISQLNYKKLHLICALTNQKNPEHCFAELLPKADAIYCTRFLNPFRKVTPPETVAKRFKKHTRKSIKTFLDPEQALLAAKKKAKKGDLILITGSFFLCGDLRSHWIPNEKQLEKRTNFPK
jgi:dihydrofolate synthase/folylpolyglutamate synthase